MKAHPAKTKPIAGVINVDFGAPSVCKDLERQEKMSIVHLLENQDAKAFLALQTDLAERRKT